MEKTSQEWEKEALHYYRNFQPHQAVECYDKALELDPNNESAYFWKSVALEKLGRCGEAIACTDTALKLHLENSKKISDLRKNLAISLDTKQPIAYN